VIPGVKLVENQENVKSIKTLFEFFFEKNGFNLGFKFETLRNLLIWLINSHVIFASYRNLSETYSMSDFI
jgi:hypothetical protein